MTSRRARACCRRRVPDLADALVLGTPALRRAPSLNRRVESLFVTLEDFSTDPVVNLGVDRLGDTVASLRPTLVVPGAGPDDLQLRDALVLEHREPAVRGRQERHLAALHHRHDAAGPELRERPVERAGERPEHRQLPAHQPVPEHRGLRPDRRSARPATRTGTRAASGSATCPATRAPRRPARRPTRGGGVMRRASQTASRRRWRAASSLVARSCSACFFAFVRATRSRRRSSSRRRSRTPEHPAELAGPDRRRRGRQGQEDRARGRRVDGGDDHDGDHRGRPADPQGRARSRSGRASSSRATSSSSCRPGSPQAPELESGEHDRHRPDRRARADRPGADDAPGRHAQEPPEPAPGLRRHDLRRAAARRGRRPGRRTPRASARRSR